LSVAGSSREGEGLNLSKQNLAKVISILRKKPEERTDNELLHIEPFVSNIQFFKENKDYFQGSQSEEESIEQQFKFICQRMRFQFYQKGDVIFRYGDPGLLFYIILKGKVSVLMPRKKTILAQDSGQVDLVETVKESSVEPGGFTGITV